MAYSGFNTQFTRVGPPNDNAPTIWTYVSTDNQTTICASGYFNALAGKLKVGDLIYFTAAASPWVAGGAGLAVVKSNTRNLAAVPPVSGVVDLFSATLINTVTNSS
jgi:hypothetical protein